METLEARGGVDGEADQRAKTKTSLFFHAYSGAQTAQRRRQKSPLY
jgi:hypothetical protein